MPVLWLKALKEAVKWLRQLQSSESECFLTVLHVKGTSHRGSSSHQRDDPCAV